MLPVDAADAATVGEAAARVERELGPVDVWINNAATSVFSPITEMQPAEFKRVTEVTGPRRGVRHPGRGWGGWVDGFAPELGLEPRGHSLVVPALP